MPFAYWMILLAACLPTLTIGMAKGASGRSYDNSAPRAWADRLQGWLRRADWAQRNHFEAFPPFAAGVLVAELNHAAQARIDLLAGIFIAARLVYTALYLADLARLRSVVWTIGFAAVILLFVAGAVASPQ